MQVILFNKAIINQKLKNELTNLDSTFNIGKEPIDVEEAWKILLSYISSVTRRALKFLGENENDDRTALSNQIRTCNSIISIMSQELDEEGEELTHIYSKINSG